jgi:hypothetical protein
MELKQADSRAYSSLGCSASQKLMLESKRKEQETNFLQLLYFPSYLLFRHFLKLRCISECNTNKNSKSGQAYKDKWYLLIEERRFFIVWQSLLEQRITPLKLKKRVGKEGKKARS